jgi:hypothetical protein
MFKDWGDVHQAGLVDADRLFEHGFEESLVIVW